jgi:hypothetical protein
VANIYREHLICWMSVPSSFSRKSFFKPHTGFSYWFLNSLLYTNVCSLMPPGNQFLLQIWIMICLIVCLSSMTHPSKLLSLPKLRSDYCFVSSTVFEYRLPFERMNEWMNEWMALLFVMKRNHIWHFSCFFLMQWISITLDEMKKKYSHLGFQIYWWH